MKILQTKNLTKRFDGVKAVDCLSIDIEKGKITGIIGPNGSGKTTLVNLLSGMVGIDGGMVIVDGSLKLVKIKPYDISAYGITRTFQEARLFNQMTVLDNVLAVLTERNVFGALFEKHNDYHLGKAKEAQKSQSLGKEERAGGQSFLRPKKTFGNRPRRFHSGGNISSGRAVRRTFSGNNKDGLRHYQEFKTRRQDRNFD